MTAGKVGYKFNAKKKKEGAEIQLLGSQAAAIEQDEKVESELGTKIFSGGGRSIYFEEFPPSVKTFLWDPPSPAVVPRSCIAHLHWSVTFSFN